MDFGPNEHAADSVTAGQARHNSSNVEGVTAGHVGHNSIVLQISGKKPASPSDIKYQSTNQRATVDQKKSEGSSIDWARFPIMCLENVQ